MKRIIITYKRIDETSLYGDGIEVNYRFYSFKPEDIDELEELLKNKIGTMLVIENEEEMENDD